MACCYGADTLGNSDTNYEDDGPSQWFVEFVQGCRATIRNAANVGRTVGLNNTDLVDITLMSPETANGNWRKRNRTICNWLNRCSPGSRILFSEIRTTFIAALHTMRTFPGLSGFGTALIGRYHTCLRSAASISGCVPFIVALIFY